MPKLGNPTGIRLPAALVETYQEMAAQTAQTSEPKTVADLYRDALVSYAEAWARAAKRAAKARTR